MLIVSPYQQEQDSPHLLADKIQEVKQNNQTIFTPVYFKRTRYNAVIKPLVSDLSIIFYISHFSLIFAFFLGEYCVVLPSLAFENYLKPSEKEKSFD